MKRRKYSYRIERQALVRGIVRWVPVAQDCPQIWGRGWIAAAQHLPGPRAAHRLVRCDRTVLATAPERAAEEG